MMLRTMHILLVFCFLIKIVSFYVNFVRVAADAFEKLNVTHCVSLERALKKANQKPVFQYIAYLSAFLLPEELNNNFSSPWQ